MYKYFIFNKNTFFTNVIVVAMLCSNQSTLFSMNFEFLKESRQLNPCLYNYFIRDVLPGYLIYDASSELTFSDSTIDKNKVNTTRTLTILECVKSLSAVNKISNTVLKEVYLLYIERIFNTSCYNEKFYEKTQEFCNSFNITCFKKAAHLSLQIACADILSSEQKSVNIPLVDLAAYGEASFYVYPPQKIIVSTMGTFYKKATRLNNRDHFFNINKKHIYENGLVHLINNNNPKLVTFFKKVFDFTPHKDYTFLIEIEERITELPENFVIACIKEGLTVKLLMDRHLLRTQYIESQSLTDHYCITNLLEVSQINNQ